MDEFGACSKKAKTVTLHAKCLSRLINNKMTGLKYLKKENSSSKRLNRYRSPNDRSTSTNSKDAWIGGFKQESQLNSMKKRNSSKSGKNDEIVRRKRDTVMKVKQQSGYDLLTTNSGISPMGSVAKLLLKQILEIKNKTKTAT